MSYLTPRSNVAPLAPRAAAAPAAWIPVPSEAPSETPFHQVRGLAFAGLAIVGLFFGVGGIWAFCAPLESAAIASGHIGAESSRKTIQHLEGGIIQEILVKDGDNVKAGDVLVQLDPTKAKSQVAVLTDQRLAEQVREARLLTERAGQDHIVWPAAIVASANEPSVAQAIASETKLFDIRSALQRAKVNAAIDRRHQAEAQIPGQRALEQSAVQQLSLYREEEAGARELLAKGLEAKPRYLQIERSMADTEAHRLDAQAQMARLADVIAENNVEVASIERDRQSEVADQLRQTEEKLAELGEQLRASQDVLSRTEIRAPEDGTVTDLHVHTPGGVVNPGEALMDLMPADDNLVVEVQLRPEEINYVHVGLPATVRLPAYRQRAMPTLNGRVTYVSPDRLTDKTSGKPYYAVTIALDQNRARPAARGPDKGGHGRRRDDQNRLVAGRVLRTLATDRQLREGFPGEIADFAARPPARRDFGSG